MNKIDKKKILFYFILFSNDLQLESFAKSSTKKSVTLRFFFLCKIRASSKGSKAKFSWELSNQHNELKLLR